MVEMVCDCGAVVRGKTEYEAEVLYDLHCETDCPLFREAMMTPLGDLIESLGYKRPEVKAQ